MPSILSSIEQLVLWLDGSIIPRVLCSLDGNKKDCHSQKDTILRNHCYNEQTSAYLHMRLLKSNINIHSKSNIRSSFANILMCSEKVTSYGPYKPTNVWAYLYANQCRIHLIWTIIFNRWEGYWIKSWTQRQNYETEGRGYRRKSEFNHEGVPLFPCVVKWLLLSMFRSHC